MKRKKISLSAKIHGYQIHASNQSESMIICISQTSKKLAVSNIQRIKSEDTDERINRRQKLKRINVVILYKFHI